MKIKEISIFFHRRNNAHFSFPYILISHHKTAVTAKSKYHNELKSKQLIKL